LSRKRLKERSLKGSVPHSCSEPHLLCHSPIEEARIRVGRRAFSDSSNMGGEYGHRTSPEPEPVKDGPVYSY